MPSPWAGSSGSASPAPRPTRRAVRRPHPERPEDVDGASAIAWFEFARELVRETPGFSPPVAARLFGYLGCTLYQAVVAGSDRFRPLPMGAEHGDRRGHGNPDADWATVADASLAEALRLFLPLTTGQLAAIGAREASLRCGRRRDVERGRLIARSIHTWSLTDGGHDGHLRNQPTDYVPPVGPGLWVPTPDANARALQPTWGRNRCFALRDVARTDPGPPTPYAEAPGSPFNREALEVYDAVRNLTAEQEAIARFWSDDPGITSTPPGHAVSLASIVLRRERASLMLAAETYAKVGMAVSDAFVACWATKYRYNLLRPVTYLAARRGSHLAALADHATVPGVHLRPLRADGCRVRGARGKLRRRLSHRGSHP